MSTSSKIKIMISSRCSDPFPLVNNDSKPLSEIRIRLKKEIDSVTIFGQAIYEVWINEKEEEDGGKQAWDHCMDQARDCDVFIALFNGNAGWADTSGTIGICHAEFEAANASAPGKVFLINIYEPGAKNTPVGPTDRAFQDYIKRLRRFDARGAVGEAQLFEVVRKTIADATVKMVRRGVKDAGRGTSYVGPALDWSRLSYAHRVDEMRSAALEGLKGNADVDTTGDRTVRQIRKKRIIFVANAVPDSMSVAAAREMVGQPHLSDHNLHDALTKVDGGPIHLVACHKGVTESQARTMLGFPDATVVSPPFGVYVVDPIQGIQLVLLAQCRDVTSTRLAVQRFLEWIDESEQSVALIQNAAKRKRVVRALVGK
jgi:Domain of unknown function (DUF4062)